MTNTWKDTIMIRYSTQPSNDAKALHTYSPTSPVKTTKDTKGLNDDGAPSQSATSDLDLDSMDQDGTD